MTKTAQIKLIEESKLGEAIGAHGRSRARLDKESHVLACSALVPFMEHGNVFYINEMFKSLGKGARHVAFTNWLFQFGGVMANKDAEKAKATPFVKDADKTVDLDKAKLNPWYNFNPSPKPADTLDVVALVKLVLDKARKAQAKTDGPQIVGAEAIPALEALVAEYGTEEDENEGAKA